MNILDYSPKELINLFKEEQRACLIENKEKIKDYFMQNNPLEGMCVNGVCKYEDQIVFLIRHFVSLKFISKYFDVSPEYVKEIAKKNKCHSQLLSNFTESINARCFSKSQLLRACEDFNYICPMCFKPLDITNISTLTGHHIQPFARGGETNKDNCLPLHVSCHFDDFKLLHSSLFDSDDPLYSAKYFNELKDKLQNVESGITSILKHC